MSLTDDLCRSFLDLWRHFDPPGLWGATLPEAGLPRLDPVSLREHTAALRSLAAAAEEPGTDSLDEEIDRTVLLDTMRAMLYRLAAETTPNPARWALGAARAGAMAETGADAATRRAFLADLPEYLAQAQAAVTRPPAALVAAADPVVETLHETVQRLVAALGEEDQAIGIAARAAADGFRTWVRRELEPDLDRDASGLGEETTDRLLHTLYAEQAGGRRMLKAISYAIERLDRELIGLAQTLGPASSWQEHWARLTETSLPGPAWADRLRQAAATVRARIGAVDPALGAIPVPPIVVDDGGLGDVELRRDDGVATLVVPAAGGSASVTELVAAAFLVPGQAAALERCHRASSLVRRELIQPAVLTGWGFYAEELFLEATDADPQTMLVQRGFVLRRLLIAAADLGIHLGQLAPATATDHLVRRFPFSRAAAEATVRGILLTPLMTAAAVAARQDLLDLRLAWANREGSFGWAAFHEAIAPYGLIPVSLMAWGVGLER